MILEQHTPVSLMLNDTTLLTFPCPRSSSVLMVEHRVSKRSNVISNLAPTLSLCLEHSAKSYTCNASSSSCTPPTDSTPSIDKSVHPEMGMPAPRESASPSPLIVVACPSPLAPKRPSEESLQEGAKRPRLEVCVTLCYIM